MQRPRQNFLARIAVFPLLALAFVNLSIAWSFWGWLDEPGSYNFRLAGVCLLAFEYCGLVILADNLARREYLRAFAMAIVVAGLFVAGLAADFGAIVTRSSGDAAERAQILSRYEAAQQSEREAAQEAERLSVVLEGQQRNLPLAALRAETARAIARRDAYAARGETAPWRITDAAARAESAEATARARDAAIASRDEARRQLAGIGARPEDADPQAQQMIALLRIIGVTVSPADVHAGLGAMFALLMRLTPMIGFVAISPAQRPERRRSDPDEGVAGEPNTDPDLGPGQGAGEAEPEASGAPLTGVGEAGSADWDEFIADAQPRRANGRGQPRRQ